MLMSVSAFRLLPPFAVGEKFLLGVRKLAVRRDGRTAARHSQVYAGDGLGEVKPQRGRDLRAPVAALRHEIGIAEPVRHKRMPHLGDADGTHAAPRRPVGESVAGHGRGDDVEGIRRVRAVSGGVRERRDYLQHLDERAGPAVRDDQRNRVRTLPARVDEVDAQPVHVRAVLGKGVDGGFLRAPVETVRPVFAQLPDIGEAGAVVPPRVFKLVGQARAAQAVFHVVENAVRYVDGVRLYVHVVISPSNVEDFADGAGEPGQDFAAV